MWRAGGLRPDQPGGSQGAGPPRIAPITTATPPLVVPGPGRRAGKGAAWFPGRTEGSALSAAGPGQAGSKEGERAPKCLCLLGVASVAEEGPEGGREGGGRGEEGGGRPEC